jgi:pilus assembly protein CpaD
MSGASHTAVVRWLPLALCLAAVAAACSPLDPPPVRPVPEALAVPVEYGHSVRFATDRAELSTSEAARLRRFVSTLPPDRRLAARIVGHADQRAGDAYNHSLSSRRAETVAAALRAMGIVPVSVSLIPMGEALATAAVDDPAGLARDRQLEVLVSATSVALPGCPDWSGDPGYDPRNEPLSNLGCANAFNLGLMVADPRDLSTGTPMAPADATREAEAVIRYRTDKVKQLDAEVFQ